MSSSDWQEIGSWNVGRPDGTNEKYILSRSTKTGDFQLKNDYGNTVIDMELMSGIEFIKKVLDKMEDEVSNDLNIDCQDWLDDLDSDSEDDISDNHNYDCDHTD
tara:strand:- start:246 stop:557 length:312 start_codon:yes stop_codon:yes gene_type:complete